MRKFLNRLLTLSLAAILLAPFAWSGITTTLAPSAISYQGSVPDQGQLTQYLSDIRTNGSAFSPFVNTVTSAVVAGDVLLPSGVVNSYLVLPNASCTTCSLTYASAVSIVQSIPGGAAGTTFWTAIANFSPGTVTIAAGTGITITGTATIARSAVRYFVGQFVTSQTVTLSSMFAVPSATF